MPTSVTNLAFQRAVLDSATAASATFDGALLGLTKALVAPSKLNTLADYSAVEADYNTYARVAQTWTVSYANVDAITRFGGLANPFVLANANVVETIYSAFLADTGGTVLLAGGSFATPSPLTSLNLGLLVVPCVNWQGLLRLLDVGLDLVTTSHADRLILNGITGMSGILHNAKAHLTTLVGGITRDTALATLAAAEATYGGYAAQTISAWSAAYVDSDGVAKVGGSDLLWQPNSSTTPNTITGVYVTNSASDTLLFAYDLDSPVVLANADMGFRDAPTLSMSS